MSINRSIEISANGEGFARTINTLGDSLSRAFERANTEIERVTGNTQSFADVINGRMTALERSIDGVFSDLLAKSKEQNLTSSERLNFLQKEIAAGEKQLRIENDRAKLAERMKYQSALKDAEESGDAAQIKQVKSSHQSIMAQMDEDNKIKELQMRGLRERFIQHKDDSIDEEKRKEEKEEKGKERDYLYAPRQAAQGFVAGYGIGGILSISGFVQKMIAEGRELDEAEAATRGLGGVRGSGTGYGLKRADYLRYGAGVIQAAGDKNYDVAGNLEFEKRFSQQQGSLNALTTSLRTEGSGRSASSVMLEMMSFFKRSKLFGIDKDDFTQIAEKMQFNTQMLEQQGAQMQQTNATTNAQLLEAFGAAGINDQRVLSYNNSINDAIRTPSSDFTQAFMFRSLRRRNPQSSLLELLKIQEQGIYGEGTFAQIMEDLRGSFQGDALTMSTSKAFGLQYHQAEQVLKMSPEQLSRIGKKEDISAILRGEGESEVTMEEGKGSAGIVTRRLAQMEDWFGKQGKKAIYKVEEYISAFEEGGFSGVFSKISGDLYSAVASAMNKIVDVISEKFQSAMNAIAEKIMTWTGAETEEEQKKRQILEKQKLDREVTEKYSGIAREVTGGAGLDSWLEKNSRLRMLDSTGGEIPIGMQSESDKLKALVYSLLFQSAEFDRDSPLSPKTQAQFGMAWQESPEYKAKLAKFDETVDNLNKLNESELSKSVEILKNIRDLMVKSNLTTEQASTKVFNEIYTTK